MYRWGSKTSRSSAVAIDSGSESSAESTEGSAQYSEDKSLATSTDFKSEQMLGASTRSRGFTSGVPLSARGANSSFTSRGLPPRQGALAITHNEDRLAATYSSPVVPFQRTASQGSLMNTYGNFGKVCDFPERKPTVNILVVGAPQVGKSSFINAHRTAVTNSNKWPTAPVGICGFYGTTTVEPFPDNPTNPSWLFIDTPGRFYDSADEPVLHLLMEGMPWRTKLAGSNALSVEEIAEVIPIPTNKANQAVIVVPANDLIEDLGWSNTLFFRNRFTTASDAESVILYCKGLVSKLRALLQDQSPFIVISKMDKVGGAGNAQARNEILSLMGQCVPVNRVYFTACPDGQSAVASRRSLTLDPATRENLLQLHEDICFSVQWRNKVTDL